MNSGLSRRDKGTSMPNFTPFSLLSKLFYPLPSWQHSMLSLPCPLAFLQRSSSSITRLSIPFSSPDHLYITTCPSFLFLLLWDKFSHLFQVLQDWASYLFLLNIFPQTTNMSKYPICLNTKDTTTKTFI